MTETNVNLYALDAAYKPFPTFAEWVGRTAVDTVRWDRYNASLKSRAQKMSPEQLEKARNVAKRAAAIDTGAIEGLYEVDRGFTFTVAFETAAWEAALAEKGAQVRPLFEAQLHAYDFVLDLATKAEPISEAAIRALHVEVCRAQSTYRVITAIGPQEQELPKGQYKTLPNHVRTRKGADHSYAPVDATPAEMARLTAELRTDAFLSAHPVLQAGYAHYALVVIHPFADGNGRVARALASAFTYRAISMPIVILSEQRDSYLNSLESSDAGDYQAFVDFMLARSLDTIGLVEESLRFASVQSADQSMTAIRALYLTRGGYTHQQVDQLGTQLMQALQQRLLQELGKRQMQNVSFTTQIVPGTYNVPPGNRLLLTGGQTLLLSISSARPAQASVQRQFGLVLPRNAAGNDDIQVLPLANASTVNSPPDEGFAARVDQLMPAISGVLQFRLNIFAERIVNELFSALKIAAETAFGRNR